MNNYFFLISLIGSSLLTFDCNNQEKNNSNLEKKKINFIQLYKNTGVFDSNETEINEWSFDAYEEFFLLRFTKDDKNQYLVYPCKNGDFNKLIEFINSNYQKIDNTSAVPTGGENFELFMVESYHKRSSLYSVNFQDKIYGNTNKDLNEIMTNCIAKITNWDIKNLNNNIKYDQTLNLEGLFKATNWLYRLPSDESTLISKFYDYDAFWFFNSKKSTCTYSKEKKNEKMNLFYKISEDNKLILNYNKNNNSEGNFLFNYVKLNDSLLRLETDEIIFLLSKQ